MITHKLKDLYKHFVSTKQTLSIIEVGCGLPIADTLMSYSGASDYILEAYSPYSKKTQNVSNSYRSVSKEFVETMCKSMHESAPTNNISLVISLQAGEKIDSHGWIAINGYGTYHFTFGHGKSKSLVRQMIRPLVAELLLTHVFMVKETPYESRYIDGAFDTGNNSINTDLMPAIYQPFIIDKGLWKRATAVLRDKSSINIVKGSFNPYHQGHAELCARENSVLSLTEITFEGKQTSLYDLVKRASKLPVMTLIDARCITINSLIHTLENMIDFNKIELHFSMGIDVYNKLTKLNPNVKYHVYNRNITDGNVSFYESQHSDLSSTILRSVKSENIKTS